jgi:CRISPR-associated endonuclease/helicase Cas3
MTSFDTVFARAMGSRKAQPYAYQRRLALDDWPEVLIAPTGMGKTAGIVLGWLWRRITAPETTARRLVYCLPMRTLVEQTEKAARGWLRELAGAADPGILPDPCHGVVVLMGGRERETAPPAWTVYPETPALIIGTQDMLLSRALMRGYGMSRFRWPVDFALLHADAQWVFDEVQAMGAGLTTSAQLHGLRAALGVAKETRSLWVSATLTPGWLRTVDHPAPAAVLRVPDDVPEDAADPRVQRLIHAPKRLVKAVARPEGTARSHVAAYAAALADEVMQAHRPGRTTLVIVNTVPRAQAVHSALARWLGAGADDRLLLIHSRFRPADRRARMKRLAEPGEAGDRIIVATQAIEAGVDLTSAVLFTELAPWSSLVQRFGRANRYGECGEAGAEIRWIDLADGKDELAAPYAVADLDTARQRLATLADAAPAALSPPGAAPRVRHVLRRKDLLDLFDTDSDLTGFDIDVSPFIRDAQDTDFQVFWRDFAALKPAFQPLPDRDELCAVPIGRAGKLLTAERPGWRLDPQALERSGSKAAAWVRIDGNRPWPGLVVMLDAARGGYRPDTGLAPESREAVPVEAPAPAGPVDAASLDGDPLTRSNRPVRLTAHLEHVAAEAEILCAALGIDGAERAAIVTAARRHDVGKAQAEFQERLTRTADLEGILLAKAEGSDRTKGRPFLRHELASALAFLGECGGEDGADLAAYLIAAHHGKVRLSLRALPAEKPVSTDVRIGVHPHSRCSLMQRADEMRT